MGSKRSHGDAFFAFDIVNCIGTDAEIAERAESVGRVASFAEAMGVDDAVPLPSGGAPAAFEQDDIDDPCIEDLGLTYSPADDDPHRSDGGGRTPDPFAMMDDDSRAIAALFGDVDDACAGEGPGPLRAPPAAAPPPVWPLLNQSGQAGCFATDRVGAQPPPPMRQPLQAREVKAVRPAAPPGQPPYWENFNVVAGNHAGVFGECGGVRAWMASEAERRPRRVC